MVSVVSSSEPCDCSILDGRTELTQLRALWARYTKNQYMDYTTQYLAGLISQTSLYENIQNETNLIEDYSYGISAKELGINRDGLIVAHIRILETKKGLRTVGGATFRATISGKFSRSSCPYTDYFNGTYLICCVLREAHNDVRIELRNVNFLSYHLSLSHNYLVSIINITNHRLQINNHGQLMQLNPMSDKEFQYLEDARLSSCHINNEFWFRSTEQGYAEWKYIDHNHEVRHMSRETINECLRGSYGNRLVLNGDSYLKNVFFYITEGSDSSDVLSNFQQGQGQGSNDFMIKLNNIFYHKSSTLNALIKHLKWFSKNGPDELNRMHANHNYASYMTDTPSYQTIFNTSTMVPPAVMVINAGSWDVGVQNTAKYIVKFGEVLELLSDPQLHQYYKIVWLGLPSWPRLHEYLDGMQTNTFMNGALNAWLAHQLRALNIPLVDFYKISVAFEDRNECDFYHLCKDGDKWSGNVGIEVIHMVLNELCR